MSRDILWSIIVLALLSGCYIAPEEGSKPAPGPVVPDLQGVALEAYQEVKKTQVEGTELSDLTGAIRLTINKAEHFDWDSDKINEEFVENTKMVGQNNSTSRDRWRPFALWMNETLKPAIEQKDMLSTMREILKGLEAANG